MWRNLEEKRKNDIPDLYQTLPRRIVAGVWPGKNVVGTVGIGIDTEIPSPFVISPGIVGIT
jgi:hypothetical protein